MRYIYIYIYISAGPNGAHGCAALCTDLVSLLSRHPAIYCQVSILLSCVKWYSSSIAKVLKGFFWFLCNCLLVTKSHGRAKSGDQNYVPLNPSDTKTTYLAAPNIPHGHLAAFGVAKQSIWGKYSNLLLELTFSTHANYYRMYTKRHRSTDRPKWTKFAHRQKSSDLLSSASVRGLICGTDLATLITDLATLI